MLNELKVPVCVRDASLLEKLLNAEHVDDWNKIVHEKFSELSPESLDRLHDLQSAGMEAICDVACIVKYVELRVEEGCDHLSALAKAYAVKPHIRRVMHP